MNREILFRAKHIHTTKRNKHLNGTWVHGYLIDKNYIYDKSLNGEFLVDESTICQYTGEKDVNGYKVYENDIVMCFDNPYYLAKVVFGEFDVVNGDTDRYVDTVKGWYFEIIPNTLKGSKHIDRYTLPFSKYYINVYNMKVIGNTFDSKRLIGETKNGESR